MIDELLETGYTIISKRCKVKNTDDHTSVYCQELSGYADDFFNYTYWIKIVKNGLNKENILQSETRRVLDYISMTGEFQTTRFGFDINTDEDLIIIINENCKISIESIKYR